MSESELKLRIIQAAQKVFDSKGINESSLEDIAENAGIKKEEISKIYKTKEKILNEVLSEGIDTITNFLQKIVNERGKADSKISKIIREILRRYEEHYPLFNLIGVSMETLDQTALEIKGVLEKEKIEKYRQNTAIIGRIIAKGQAEGLFSDVNPLETAYYLRGLINSAIKYWQIMGKTQPLENYTDSIIKIFFKGIYK